MKNGLVKSYPSLRKNIACDILIVGGGITGALMAYEFSRAGYKTVLIDKRDVGTGSTCATTAMIQYELDESLHSLIDKLGRDQAVGIYEGAIQAVNKLTHLVDSLKIECGLLEKQSLLFAHKVADVESLRKEFECRKMAGISVNWLGKEEVVSRFGIISEGGILSDVGASLDAYQFTHALLEYTTNTYALQVYDHTKMTDVQHGHAKNFVNTDTAAVIECGKIIYTTGYESHEVIRSNIGKLISTYACVSEPLDYLPPSLMNTIFWNTEDPYLYFRMTIDNRILIGGEDEDFKNPERRDDLIEQKENELVKKFHKVMPGVKFIADFSWAGTFGATKDSLPYAGEHPDYPNSYFMLGFGGNGITFSVMGMEILSDAVAGRRNKFLDYFRFGR